MKTYMEIKILDSKMNELRSKCKCGHTQFVPKRKDREFGICTWCGERIYSDPVQQKEYVDKCKKEAFKKTLLTRYLKINSTGELV